MNLPENLLPGNLPEELTLEAMKIVSKYPLENTDNFEEWWEYDTHVPGELEEGDFLVLCTRSFEAGAAIDRRYIPLA